MASEVTITIKTERKLMIPTLPNFMRTPKDEAVDVGELTDEQIREIGARWTEALVRKARDRRGDRITAINREIKKVRG